jgi:serine/threonine protein kinase
MVVKSCYALVFNVKERPRRKSWGSAPSSAAEEEEPIPTPDRVLILRGATINRSSTARDEFDLKCADGTSMQCRAPDARSRDAWVAALDRAVRQGDAQLSDFETYAKLARGHFGTVQLVKHIRTGTALALKTIEIKPKKPEKQYHERAILELLQSGDRGINPFIARLCFAFRDATHLYLATELASGGDLWALLRKRRRLQEVTCRFISAELVLAVRHVHSHGVLHRDIKLENLLLDGQGHVKLVDFGLSKRLFDPSTGLWDGRTFTVCGTNVS